MGLNLLLCLGVFYFFFFSPAGVAFILGPFLILWVSGREDGAAVKESSSSAQPHSHEEATFTLTVLAQPLPKVLSNIFFKKGITLRVLSHWLLM